MYVMYTSTLTPGTSLSSMIRAAAGLAAFAIRRNKIFIMMIMTMIIMIIIIILIIRIVILI